MNKPIVSPLISFKEFKDTVKIIKYGQLGFVFLFQPLYSGYKYKIVFRGANKSFALDIAYYYLFGETTDTEKKDVRTSLHEHEGFKIPLAMSFECCLFGSEDKATECKKLMGRKLKAKRLILLSPDGFTIHPTDTYATKESAEEAFLEWKKRFEHQGYYSSPTHGRIQLEELADFMTLKEA